MKNTDNAMAFINTPFATREAARKAVAVIRPYAESCGIKVKSPVKDVAGWNVPGFSFGKTLSLHK